MSLVHLTAFRNLEPTDGELFRLKCPCGWAGDRHGFEGRRHWVDEWRPFGWEALNRLHAGQKIEVVETGLKTHRGAFVAVSAEAIQLREGTTDEPIGKENITRVTLLDKGHHARNALIFGAVGVGLGAELGAAAQGRNKIGGRGPGAGVGAAIGFLGGAVVGIGLALRRIRSSTLFSLAPKCFCHARGWRTFLDSGKDLQRAPAQPTWYNRPPAIEFGTCRGRASVEPVRRSCASHMSRRTSYGQSHPSGVLLPANRVGRSCLFAEPRFSSTRRRLPQRLKC